MKTSRQVVNLNLFLRFLEERLVWKNHFEFVWPLTSSYFALIESDDRPVNRECPICTHSIHYMSIGMRILVALIKTILCTIFELSPRPALKKSTTYIFDSLLICTWFLKNQFGKIKFKELQFQVYFELDFYCLCSLQKSILKLTFVR